MSVHRDVERELNLNLGEEFKLICLNTVEDCFM